MSLLTPQRSMTTFVADCPSFRPWYLLAEMAVWSAWRLRSVPVGVTGFFGWQEKCVRVTMRLGTVTVSLIHFVSIKKNHQTILTIRDIRGRVVAHCTAGQLVERAILH